MKNAIILGFALVSGSAFSSEVIPGVGTIDKSEQAVSFTEKEQGSNELYFLTGGFSKHYKQSGQNEVHPSVGIQYNNFSVIYVDKNSIENHSVQVAYSDNFYESKWIDFGYRVGLATGYQKGTVFDDGRRTYSGLDVWHGVIPIIAAETTIRTPVPNFSLVIDALPNAAIIGAKYRLH